MRSPYRLFDDWEIASWMWARLRAAFPAMVSASLMPGHKHLAPEVNDPHVARERLARICGHLQRRLGIFDLFEPLPRPQIIAPDKAARMARYIDLNPCRAGLVEHPLAWPWTTLRDLVGAAAEPWVDPIHHGRSVGRVGANGADAWLRYVLQDDRVRDRRPLAKPVSGRADVPACGVCDLVRGTAAALRTSPAAIGMRGPARALFLALAADQKVTNVAPLRVLTGASRSAVERGLRRCVPDGWLAAARLCLADSRLTSAVPSAALCGTHLV